MIDFFSPEDLAALVATLASERSVQAQSSIDGDTHEEVVSDGAQPETMSASEPEVVLAEMLVYPNTTQLSDDPVTPAAPEEPREGEEDLYSVTSFTV